MRDEAIRDLAVYLGQRPSAPDLADHLASITLVELDPTVTTLHDQADPPLETDLVLIGQCGLTREEAANYERIEAGCRLPAAEAIHRSLPYEIGFEDLAERFPLLRMRPDLPAGGCLFVVPIPRAGLTSAVLTCTLPRSIDWNPETWQGALALQALMGLHFEVLGPPKLGRRRHAAPPVAARSLTERQQAILALVAQGKSTSSIATRLGFSSSTIKQDVHRAMLILGVETRQQAALKAHEFRLIS